MSDKNMEALAEFIEHCCCEPQYKIPYTHDELIDILSKIKDGHVLTENEYDLIMMLLGSEDGEDINNVIFSGDYIDLINKPFIPTKLEHLRDYSTIMNRINSALNSLTAKDELLTASNNGKCLRFAAENVRTVGRTSQGVKGMKIEQDEEIIDMIVLNNEMDILTVTEKGYAKRTKPEDYRLQGRRGKGVKAGVFNDKTGKVVALRPITAENDILAISADGVMIRTHADSINLVGRTSLGVRLMKVSAQDKVVSVSVVERQNDEEDESTDSTEINSTNE